MLSWDKQHIVYFSLSLSTCYLPGLGPDDEARTVNMTDTLTAFKEALLWRSIEGADKKMAGCNSMWKCFDTDVEGGLVNTLNQIGSGQAGEV